MQTENALWREILAAVQRAIASAENENESEKSCLALRHSIERYRTVGPFSGTDPDAPSALGVSAEGIVFRLERVLHVHGYNPPFVGALTAELPNIEKVIDGTEWSNIERVMNAPFKGVPPDSPYLHKPGSE